MAEMFRISSVALCSALAAGTSFAQPAPSEVKSPQTLVANKLISLVTKTPLGDAAMQIAPGTPLTNAEVQGERVKIWQGPFSATVDLAELQTFAGEGAPTPEPSTTPSPASSPTPPPPEPSPTETPEASKSPELQVSFAPAEIGVALPSWVLPALCGALAAYAVFATLALLRSHRKTPAAPAKVATKAPVVTLPTKAAAMPAVVADEGRAIACPLCGKSIPLEKVIKGRNRCPSCLGSFVGE